MNPPSAVGHAGHSAPFLTAAIPGCGGHFKETPEDFEVEEVPAYLPSGDGEHLFIWIEKRGLSTPEAGKRLVNLWGISERDLSWAGLKDKQAVTRQWLCVPSKKVSADEAMAITDPEIKVLEAKQHKNKLKNGHLNGNRFRLRLREVKDLAAAKASFDEIVKRGLPNLFGPQRFGHSGQNAARGKAILVKGGKGSGFERKLLLSAFQSLLFNRVLSQRLQAGQFSTVLKGDVLKKHETGGEFICADPVVDQPRADVFEVSPTGRCTGRRCGYPKAKSPRTRRRCWRTSRSLPETFLNGKGETEGARRFLRVQLEQPSFEPTEDHGLWLTFTLPSGSYATVLLRELLKDGLRGGNAG